MRVFLDTLYMIMYRGAGGHIKCSLRTRINVKSSCLQIKMERSLAVIRWQCIIWSAWLPIWTGRIFEIRLEQLWPPSRRDCVKFRSLYRKWSQPWCSTTSRPHRWVRSNNEKFFLRRYLFTTHVISLSYCPCPPCSCCYCWSCSLCCSVHALLNALARILSVN